MQPNLANRLQTFAEAAVCHAAEEYGLELSHQRLDVVDRVLDLERSDGKIENRSALKLCYGAWFGEWGIANAGGQWVGLFEPVPPRIVVNGVPTSPMDAIERRMIDSQAPSIHSLAEQWVAWSKLNGHDEQIITLNRIAWDSRHNDIRFVGEHSLPTDRGNALAAIDPWLLEEGSLEGRRVLCLAAGGGTHGPLFAMAGAIVTVIDFSPRQLAIDRHLASLHSLEIQTVETSIDDLSVLNSASFDAVVQPVSTCYVRDIGRVYSEVARVLRPHGLYIAQHKQPASLQADAFPTEEGFLIRNVADEGHGLQPSSSVSSFRESEMTEFIHSWDALIGSLCRSGFVLEDLQEPPRGDAWAKHGSPEHRSRYLPPYVKVKARRIEKVNR